MNQMAFVEGFTLLFVLSWMVGSLVDLVRGAQPRLGLMASIMYPNAFVEMAEGDMDIVAGVMRMMLLNAHTESVDDDFVNDISGDEASGGSYARVTLSNPAMTYDAANDRAEYDFDDVVFSSLGAAAGLMDFAAAYLQTGGNDASESDDPLLCAWDIADTTPDGSDFTLQPGSEGALQLA